MGVSVVIPTRDRVDLLERTLATVRDQTLPSSIIVVDDGSTDGTAERLSDAPVTVVRNDGPAWGAARARNAGVARATTELVAFVDSDDLLLPRALEALAASLERDPAAPFAYGCGIGATRTARGWLADGLIAPPAGRPGDLLVRNPVPSSGVLARRAALEQVGGFDEGLVYSEDHDLWLRLAALGAPAHVPDIVVVHRRHPGNRHDQAGALHDENVIMARSREQAAVPERRGTLLCEHAIAALKGRSPGDLARAVDTLWLGKPASARVLRAAVRHQRFRRRAAEAGRQVLADRPDLREWLETVSP